MISPTKAADILESVEVDGNQRIEVETVRSYLKIREGETFDSKKINQSLKNLFATGLFADVEASRDGKKLIIKVVENPMINRVAFEGNRRIKDETLEVETRLRERVVYTRTHVQNDVQRLVEIYRRSGRFAVKVEPKVIQLPQNRVDLIFEIDEGPLTAIRRISFVGNKQFSDGELRDEIQTRESAWWRFLTSDDTYDPDRLTFDRELLRKFYLRKGYADFRVVSAVAELTRDRKNFYVTFTLEEGQRYRLGDLNVTSKLRDLDAELLVPGLIIEKGDWYNADEVEDTIQLLTDKVGNLGYAFVDIRPEINQTRENNEINITFKIDEGPRVYVERINITGNVRTIDKVIRREFNLAEGDAFNSAKIRRSRQNISNLGLFEKVDVRTERGSQADQSVLVVDVEEKSTGELSFGVGISTVDGFLGDISIRERNLLGRGQDLRVGLKLSKRRQEVDLGFTEPYFLDRDISAGFDVFRKKVDLQEESSFDQDTIGFTLRANYTFAEDFRHGINYDLREDQISNVDATASRLIKQQEGIFITSSIGQSITYDIRDSRLQPTKGYVVKFSQAIAGIGGDVHYLKHSTKNSYHWPLWSDWVGNAAFTGGHVVGLGEDVRVNDRFFLGGSNFRGFKPGGLGPRDRNTDDSLGGNIFYVGTAEMTVPLNITKDFDLDAALFSDIGSIHQVDDSGAEVSDPTGLRASIGVGVGYRSPFGPIRLDYSQAILKQDLDQTENLRFSFGARF